MNNRLKHIKKIGQHDYYEYKPSMYRLFYINFEKLTFRKKMRFLLSYFKGYRIYYMFEKNNIIGYCMVSKGGGYRYRFTKNDDIIVGPYYIVENERGKGKSIILVNAILHNLNIEYKHAFDYIRKNNIPSIKTTEKAGFSFVSNAKISKYLRAIQLTDDGTGSFVVYKYKKK